MKRIIFLSILLTFLLCGQGFSQGFFSGAGGGGGGAADDTAYGAAWDNSTSAPTQNAVYDKIQTLGTGDVTGPATTTENNIPQWDSTTKKLKDGKAIGTASGTIAAGDHAHALAKGYLYIPAGTMTPITSAGLATVNQNPNMTDYLAFDGATDEYASFTLSPEDWDLSTIKAKFIWYASAAMTNGHTVIWGLNCYAVSDGDTSDVAFDTGEVTVSDAYATSDETGPIQKTTAATAAITVQGTPAAGDVVHCRVSRDADTDTSTIDAWLVGVKIEYGKTTPAAW